MNRKEKEGLIEEVKELEKFKYSIIQKINKLVFALIRIIIDD